MKRKTIYLLMFVIMLYSFYGCEPIDTENSDHSALISEIGEKNREYHEKRKAFRDSEVYKAAEKYIRDTLQEIFPGCEIDFSLEPGSLAGKDLSEYEKFSDDAEVRKAFFGAADLYIYVNFWDYDTEGMTAAEKLMDYGISGRLAADEYRQDIYRLNAAEGKAVFVQMPGV